MTKENIILNSDFIDFELFVVPSQNSGSDQEISSSEKSILLCYENEEDNAELDQLLKNILGAAKIDIDQQVLLLKRTPETFPGFVNLKKKWPLKDVILFGINPKKLGLNYNLSLYQPFEKDGNRFLCVDHLTDIHSNIQKKKALWSCLQDMYLK